MIYTSALLLIGAQMGAAQYYDEQYEPKKPDYYEPKKDEYYEPKKHDDYYEPKKHDDYEPKKHDYYEPMKHDYYEPKKHDYYEPKKHDDYYEPKKHDGYYEPKKHDDYYEPTKHDYYEPKKHADYYEPKKHADYYEPKKHDDYYEPKKHDDYYEPKKHADYYEPKKHADYYEPKKHEPKKAKCPKKSAEALHFICGQIKCNFNFHKHWPRTYYATGCLGAKDGSLTSIRRKLVAGASAAAAEETEAEFLVNEHCDFNAAICDVKVCHDPFVVYETTCPIPLKKYKDYAPSLPEPYVAVSDDKAGE